MYISTNISLDNIKTITKDEVKLLEEICDRIHNFEVNLADKHGEEISVGLDDLWGMISDIVQSRKNSFNKKEIEMLPCPSCTGGKDNLSIRGDNEVCYVQCGACGTRGPYKSVMRGKAKYNKAIEAWNSLAKKS